MFERHKYLFSYHILNRVGFGLSLQAQHLTREINEMKQLEIFDTDYESCNYTKTSQEALATIKPKIKTKSRTSLGSYKTITH